MHLKQDQDTLISLKVLKITLFWKCPLLFLSHCLERAVLTKVEEVYWIFAKWPSMTARSTRWVDTLKMFPTCILHVFDNLKERYHVTVADQDDALLIVSIAKRAVECSGDLSQPGVHGKVAGLIKDKVERGLGLGGWQCVVGQKGTFGCCLSPAPNNYFNFDLPTVTVLMFKAT